MTIDELRILPPLAIGRLGAAPTPMDNYEARIDPERPLGYRELIPAQTLEVNAETGAIERAFVPERLTFTEDGAVRPVAPFLEVWAVADGMLRPLTIGLLADAGLSPADVRWQVHVGNHKVFRRTGQDDDKVEAKLDWFSDHDSHELLGHCKNFWPDKTLPLGWARSIKPTEAFPEIRLRFTPAHGYVYGSSTVPPAEAPHDENVHEFLYDARPGHGTWLGYADPEDPKKGVTNTIPAQIYAADDAGHSKGYLDDECDGLVSVSLELGGRTLSAFARVLAGPPAYAPDSFPIRTILDELDQALLGPEVDEADLRLEDAEEILRRAYETIRLMNTAVMNGNVFEGRVNVASTMVSQDTGDTGRLWEPIMAPPLVDSLTLRNLHQSVFTALRSGTAAWFVDVLRRYDEIGDLSDKGRRKMPALMRGADGRYLALTRRQHDLFEKLAAGEIFTPPDEPAPPPVTPEIAPTNLTAQLHYRAAANPPSTVPDSAISNAFPGLESDFRNIWRRVFEDIELHEADNYVVHAEGEHAHLQGRRLLYVEGRQTMALAEGPVAPGRDPTSLTSVSNPHGAWTLEWSNSLATVIAEHSGKTVTCLFTKEEAPLPVGPVPEKELESVELKVRPLFAESETGRRLAVLDREIARPGELTQSLCSPWQNDYRECACYYWASSRPDYVNVEADEHGESIGNSWLAKSREPRDYVLDDRKDERLWSYEDLFQAWQERLRFVVGGREVDPDGSDGS